MSEVIDLTLDSPPPKGSADDESRARKKERRAERKEEKRESRRHRKRDSRRKQGDERDREERDPDEERRSHRSRDEKDDGKRRREPSRERDSDRKRSRRERERVIPNEELFVLDATPAVLPAAARYTAATTIEEPSELILPAHVSVFGETPAPILPTEPLDSDEEDYIEYLDYDNRKDFVRYYEEQPEEKRTKIICKKCGEEGHATAECTVLIDCPNRRADRWTDGCERCHSSSHQKSECPLLWRVYVYVEEADHKRIVQTRKEKEGLLLGQGGEGYIARDACCYNCGGSGHWGDDCREFYHPEPLVQPTAFSYHWVTQGPFTVSENVVESRPPRDWVSDVPLPGGVENVGRQAKRKEMEKLALRAQQRQEADDDPADWFQNMGNGKKREREREHSGPGNPPTGPRKMVGSSAKEPPTFQFSAAPSAKISLGDRLTDRAPDRRRDANPSNFRDHDSRDRASSLRHHNELDRDRGPRDRGSRYREDRGPRYKGGYSR
ncbi:hypothetical protein DFH08DRAFT_981944 [Mycena albidolilacea]|uniref:CCHC-type domain-containing protein n=1 Tax=Mycena albidolilacea TaxID=1033008 RepID=A0AAD7AUH7_9AGAR|nr:hypothetical protein DFH08DRAFT_981944 [Mycena albidolilacea]